MKFNIKRMPALALITAIVIGNSTIFTVAAADYHIDDTFRYIAGAEISPVSGWDFNKIGGDVLYTANKGVILSDTSYKAPVSMERTLSHKEGSNITFEAVLKPDRRADGIELVLLSGSDVAVRIYTTPKMLMLSNGDSSEELCTYSQDNEIGVKITVDTAAKTVTPVINGKTYASKSIKYDKLDKLKISTPEKFKVNLYVDSVKAYSGYSMNERFISSCGIIPDNWKLTGEAELVKNNNATDPDVYSMSLAQGSSAKTDFSPIKNGKSRYELRFLAEDSASFVWRSGESTVINIKADGSKLTVNGTDIGSYNPSVWQRMEIEVDSGNKTAAVMKNGKYVLRNIQLSSTEINTFSATAEGAGMFIDDILVYTDTRSEISVPAINAASSNDKYVGMMRCDIWREGNHLGWDYILPYEENHPYLGFYDDGNSVVSDWETKWMAEHGVDFQLHCWFLPQNYTNDTGAIKTPNNAFAIEDGYFHSNYSDKLDFAIMWENTTTKDITYNTFVNCIIPYWVEYYLSDERYASVDNKAVIGIYNVSAFLEGVGGGSTATAKQALDTLREECVKLGYSGAYILCCSKGLSSLSQEAEMGFDACHAYSWRDFSDGADVQKDYLSRAAANAKSAGIGIVPTASIGIDETPWGRPSGNIHTPAVFKEIVEYANTISSTGNMLLLDNWNEFGEGHYIMPAGKAGFGYLDAVREVLTDNALHTDIVPSEGEKAAMGMLFDKSRKPKPTGEAVVPYGTEAAYEWTGEELYNSWKGTSNLNLAYGSGILSGSSASYDTAILAKGLNIPLENVNYIEVCVQRKCADTTVKMYYMTDNDTGFTESKSIYVYAGVSNEWETLYIPVWKNTDFTGTLKQLRFDIINSAGSFGLKSIRLLKGDGADLSTLYIDGEKVSINTPLQTADGVLYADFTDIAKCFGAGTTYDAQLDAVKFFVNGDEYIFSADGTLFCNNNMLKKYSPLKAMCSTYMLPLEVAADIFGYMLAGDGSAVMTRKPLFPEITYSASDDVDSSGKWIYRNLALDPDCEDLSKFWQSTYTNDADTMSVSGECHSGTGSIEKLVTRYNRLGVEADLKANNDYHFSAWMRDKSSGNSNTLLIAAEYKVYDEKKLSQKLQQMILTQSSASQFTLGNEWNYINRDVRITQFEYDSITYPIGADYTIDSAKLYVTQSVDTERTVYIDDLNIRLIPDFRVYTKALSHLDGGLIGNEEVVFTFSNEIDKWTVTPENILINGESGLGKISVDLRSDDETKETDVAITFNTPVEKGTEVEISLADIRDAWGREVIGTTKLSVKGGKPYLTASFSNNEGNVNAQFTVHNADSGKLIVVPVCGDMLTTVQSYNITQSNKQFTVTVSKNTQWDELRVFLWSDYKIMLPLREKNMFTKKEITAATEGSA